jgi:hypothetical protein
MYANGNGAPLKCARAIAHSGVGNLLTVRNIGNTRVQLSPCLITASPCP